MNRINNKFQELSLKNKKAFIGFITAGDPSIDKTEKLVYALEEGGVDIIELGIPFSDPLADGEAIQAASQRALDAGITIKKVMNLVKKIRTKSQVPLVYLVYFNTIIIYGKEKFIAKCEEVGIDGLVVPDLPYEERYELIEILKDTNISLIPLVAPTSKDRIKKIVKECSGFVYCVSSLGVTGGKSNFYSDIKSYLKDVKENSHLPIAVGFGISNKEDIKNLENYVDGIIVGSAIVREVERTNGDEARIKNYIKNLIS